MEGDSVHSRPWSLFLRLLPSPIRWVGMEFVRFVHWVDHCAGRAVVDLRSSPSFFFVTVAGVTTVGLTIGLFISMIVPSPTGSSQIHALNSAAMRGRVQLEKNHEWSAQDRWRVAHLFVPHKAPTLPKDIQLDTRLMASVADLDPSNPGDPLVGRINRRSSEFDVRLEINRPQQAELDTRIVEGSIGDSRHERQVSLVSRARFHVPRCRIRAPRLQVQASWEFRDDCRPYYESGLPVTSIPRHVPKSPTRRRDPLETDRPLPPIGFAQPDISLEMQMFRLHSISSPFPPNSRTISLSQRSTFPLDSQSQHQHASSGLQNWQPSNPASHRAFEESIQYAGVGIYEPRSEQQQFLDNDDLSLPATAEIDLRVEFVVPQAAAAGQTSRSMVLVHNEGHQPISRIEVKEALDQFHAIVEAVPDAAIETVAGTTIDARKKFLHREVEGLSPGDNREFFLDWIPEGSHRQTHRARVIAHAMVAAATDVSRGEPVEPEPAILPEPVPESEPETHPALACDVRYLEKVVVGESFEFEIAVRNTGDIPLHNVQVKLEIPEQLSHSEGQNVVFDAGDLPVKGRSQTVLKISAKHIGDAVNQLRVASAEQVEARGIAKILVVDRVSNPTPSMPVAIRPKTALMPVPEEKAPKRPSGCFCQQASANQIKPKNLIP